SVRTLMSSRSRAPPGRPRRRSARTPRPAAPSGRTTRSAPRPRRSALGSFLVSYGQRHGVGVVQHPPDDRQLDDERSALTRRAGDAHGATMGFGDRADDRQAESRTFHAAAGFRPYEALEDPLGVLRRDARA